MKKMKTVTEKRFFEYHEDDISVTLRNKSGSFGGGVRSSRYLLYQYTVGALCQDDYKGPNRQYVEQQKLIIEVVDDADGAEKHSIRTCE